MFIDIVVSFIISALAGMGVGGGGLLVIYLALVKNMDQFTSQGINLIFFIFAAVSALSVNIKKKAIDIKTVVILAVSGLVFAVIGAVFASVVDVYVLRKIFGGLLVISGVFSVFHKETV